MTDRIILEDGISIALRRSARARRITLRVSRVDGGVTLTLPQRLTESEGIAFLRARRDWLGAALTRLPAPQRVEAGAMLPVRGRALAVTPAPVRAPRIEGKALLVPQNRPPGAAAEAFLKTLAQSCLSEASDRYATALGRGFRCIALRDTRSRWGSCTQDGRLMYSWRLAMAPDAVLDYVAAHEVAHLAHMDHSPAFWAVVGRLCPDHARHRSWLRGQGAALLAWRFRD